MGCLAVGEAGGGVDVQHDGVGRFGITGDEGVELAVEEADEVAFTGEIFEAGNGRLAGERGTIRVASGGELEEGIVAQGVAIVAVGVSGEDLEDALADHFADAVGAARARIVDGGGEIPDVAAGEGILHEQGEPGVRGEPGLVEGDPDFAPIRGLEKEGLRLKLPPSRFLVGFFSHRIDNQCSRKETALFVNFSG
jgi:hypothetical protein